MGDRTSITRRFATPTAVSEAGHTAITPSDQNADAAGDLQTAPCRREGSAFDARPPYCGRFRSRPGLAVGVVKVAGGFHAASRRYPRARSDRQWRFAEIRGTKEGLAVPCA